jgi:ABC-2 type transport system ATP-binding protein
MASLEDFGINPDQRVGKLSGGQRAVVALLCGLGKRPLVNLLDEPAAALDPLARQDVLRLIMRGTADMGTTSLISTHELSDVQAICDRIIILSEGHIVLSDSIDFILQTHRIISSKNSSVTWPRGARVIQEYVQGGIKSALLKLSEPVEDSQWVIEQPTLQEIVIAYLHESKVGL